VRVGDRVNDGGQGARPVPTMRRILARREALGLIGMASTAALLSACGDSNNTPTPTPSPTPTPGPAPTPTPTTCAVFPAETSGPFPADGTNTAPGFTSNILTQSGVSRTDLRASFANNSTAATPGVPVLITLTLVNTNASCAPLANYAVYLWGANAQGRFSLYDVPAESWLRGVQVSNAQGAVTFTTIFPGVYANRFPHLFVEVFPSAAAATNGSQAILRTQLVLPAAVANAVYTDPTNYAGNAARFAAVSIATDPVFGDNSAAQIAAMTPSFTGGISTGFTAAITLGIAV
jgi:protocatechuate 3,4-dioxygenase beta subunit